MLAVSFGPAGVLAAFGAGMLSFLSPCVLPLVPGYLSLMSGVGTAELAVTTVTDTRRLLRSTLLFVAGFTVVFVAYGAAATALGSALRTHQTGLNQIAGAVVFAMGLVVAGVVSPRVLARERRFQVSPVQLGRLAPPVMGMAFAFGWTPCIGPVLATILTAAAATRTVVWGGVLLAFYSIGLGLPFIGLALGFQRARGSLDWLRRNGRWVEVAGGVLLVAVGLLFVSGAWRDLFLPLQRRFADLGWPPI